jgi:hypothetical protein
MERASLHCTTVHSQKYPKVSTISISIIPRIYTQALVSFKKYMPPKEEEGAYKFSMKQVSVDLHDLNIR